MGEILFLPEGAASTLSGGAVKDGKFLVPKDRGLMIGKYRVSVSSNEVRALPPGEMTDMGETHVVIELLPSRYNEQTELTFEVTAGGTNVLELELQSE